jgi:alanyl-tRNA synthetase
LTALIFEKGLELDEAGFTLQCKNKKIVRAASEVSTEDWSVLFPGNVETFVGYDQKTK